MRTKLLCVLLASLGLSVTAWLVHEPNPARADEVPEKYRDTVARGLAYLAKHQHKDGHWEGDGGQHPGAVTALAGLALLMEKQKVSYPLRIKPAERKYAANIRKAVDWLMSKSQGRGGLIYSEHPSETSRYMEGHGLATLFLSAVCEDETDKAQREKLTQVLTKAVKYIVKAQSSQGGWYHTSKVEGHDLDTISATILQIQALQAAHYAGVPVPGEIIRDGQEYLKMALGKTDKSGKAGRNNSRLAEYAGALACSDSSKAELFDKWSKVCQTDIPVGRAIQFGRDELTHYYYSQAVFPKKHPFQFDPEGAWKKYRTAMFDHLQSSQNKDGSWPAPMKSKGGLGVGQIYSTAVWCIVLQLDRRSHPLVRPDIVFAN